MQSTGTGIYIVQDRKFAYISPFFEELSGYSMAELDGKIPLDLVHPDDRDSVKKQAVTRLKKGRGMHPYEYRFVKKNGDVMWVMERITSIEYAGRRAALGNFMDINQRKELESTLAKAEGRHRAILDQMHDACFEVDLAGRFVYTNRSMCRTLQYKRDELTGSDYHVIIPESDAEAVSTVFRRIYDTGNPDTAFSHRVRRKDGLEFFVESSVALLRDDKGKPTGYICVGRDVSERKRLELALVRSEGRFRNIIENMQDSYYEVDLAGNFTFVNDATSRHLFYTVEELIGSSYRMIMSEAEAKRVFDIFHQVFMTGEPNRGFSHMVTRKDGVSGYAESSISLLKDENGRPVGFSSISRDITERQALEEALSQSEERYRTILEEMYEAYYEVDLAGNFTFVNDAVCANLGYARDEIIGQSYGLMVPPGETEILFAAFNQVFKTGEYNKGFAHRGLRKDGTVFHAETSVSLRKNEKGQPIGFRSISRDVTGRKELEEKLLDEENFSSSVIDSMPGIFYALDEKGDFVRWNKNFENVLGYSADEIARMNALATIAETDKQNISDAISEVFSKGSKEVEGIMSTKYNRQLSYLLTGVRALVNDKSYLVGMGIDISERKKLEDSLRRSEERFRTILENMQDSYFEVDLNGNFTFVNLSASNRLGYARGELHGKNYRFTTPPEDLANTKTAYSEVYNTGIPKKNFLHKSICKDGSVIFVESSIDLIKDENGTIIGFNSVSRDVTERMEFQQRLADMATHDFLTGLPNRVLLNDRLHVALAQAQRNKNKLGILTLDLDRFKAVNDTHGHHVGDELLKAVGQRLTGILRSGDTIARMGGDEFMLLMPELHQSDSVSSIISKIVAAFKGAFIIEGHRLSIDVSIGIAIYPDDGTDMETLMRKSDSAMYDIKKHGPSKPG
ncbi:MAG: PAS domain S-box protein [Chloroflexi bacterium]|nr:PAS domain S-box protein [Chloroflexota bacterium]